MRNNRFKIKAKYMPALSEKGSRRHNLKNNKGYNYIVLLGTTGSQKTFTVADNIIIKL
jgi:excinuclease UvrABC helicase subunit UvrB